MHLTMSLSGPYRSQDWKVFFTFWFWDAFRIRYLFIEISESIVIVPKRDCDQFIFNNNNCSAAAVVS